MTSKKEWKRLVKMKKANTRIVSLGIDELRQIDQDPEKDLEGKWVIDNKRLWLDVREREEVIRQNQNIGKNK